VKYKDWQLTNKDIMKKSNNINVQGLQIGFMQSEQKDYICITDIAKHKNP